MEATITQPSDIPGRGWFRHWLVGAVQSEAIKVSRDNAHGAHKWEAWLPDGTKVGEGHHTQRAIAIERAHSDLFNALAQSESTTPAPSVPVALDFDEVTGRRLLAELLERFPPQSAEIDVTVEGAFGTLYHADPADLRRVANSDPDGVDRVRRRLTSAVSAAKKKSKSR